MSTDLLVLAVQAMDDTSAQTVLADALEESGWWDERLEDRWDDGPDHGPNTFRRGDHVGPQLARAIAAVLLFGEWSEADATTLLPAIPWPAALACRRPYTAAEERIHSLMADMGLPEIVARCEKDLARMGYPVEVGLLSVRDCVVRAHAYGDVAEHVLSTVERDVDAALPFCGSFELSSGPRRRRPPVVRRA